MSTDQTIIEAAAAIMAEEVARDPDRYPCSINFGERAQMALEDCHDYTETPIGQVAPIMITAETVADLGLERLRLDREMEEHRAAGMTQVDLVELDRQRRGLAPLSEAPWEGTKAKVRAWEAAKLSEAQRGKGGVKYGRKV